MVVQLGALRNWKLGIWSASCLLTGAFASHWALQPASTPPQQKGLVIAEADARRDVATAGFVSIPDTSLDTELAALGLQPPPTLGSADVPAPWKNTIHIHHEVSAAEPANPPVKLSQTGPAKVDEPKALTVDAAAPIHEATARDAAIRAVIEAEVPDATTQQKEVWLEALRDVDDPDVAGILRMWKMFGVAPEAPHTSLNVTEEKGTIRNADILQQVEAIHTYNVRRSGQPGFVPQRAWLFPTGSTGESVSVRTSLEIMKYERSFPTHFPLDLQIVGPGLFRVQDNQGNLFYTRWGRMSLDAERKLCIRMGAESYALSPEVKLTDATATIEVRGGGFIARMPGATKAEDHLGRILLAWAMTPDSFEVAPNGLLKAVAGAEHHISLGPPSENGFGALRSGRLEVSIINPQEDREALTHLQNQLQR